MKRLSKFATIVAVLGVLLLALPFPVFATPPEEVVFDFEFYFTGPDSAAGSFCAEGAIEDCGETTVLDSLTIQVKDLDCGDDETHMPKHLTQDLDPEERKQVDEWLKLPPKPEEVDPTQIPKRHRELFLATIKAPPHPSSRRRPPSVDLP